MHVAGTVAGTGLAAQGRRNDNRGVAPGASMTAPHVAGVVALLLHANPDLTPVQVQKVLAATAKDRQAPGRDMEAGYGLVDAALVLAERLQAGEPERKVFGGFAWAPSL